MRVAVLLTSLIALPLFAGPHGPRVELRVVINPEVAHVGQQVTVTWILDSNVRVDAFDFVREPAVDFVTMPLPNFTNAPAEQWPQYSGSVRRFMFYPEEPGEVHLPAAAVRARVPLDSVTDGRPYDEVDVGTEARTIVVLPLPANTNPSAVGAFHLDCSAMKSVNGAVTFDAVVNGTGSLFDTIRPHLAAPVDASFELSAQPVATTLSSGPVYRSQVWHVTFRGGAQRRVVAIPDLVLDYFDPKLRAPQRAVCKGRQIELPAAR